MISFLFAKTEENDPASQALLIHLYADHYGLWVSKLNSFSGIDDANDIIQDTFVAMLSKTELLKTLPEAKQIRLHNQVTSQPCAAGILQPKPLQGNG